MRGGPGRSKGVPGAPGPPRPRKRPIFSQIQNPPLLNRPLATADLMPYGPASTHLSPLVAGGGGRRGEEGGAGQHNTAYGPGKKKLVPCGSAQPRRGNFWLDWFATLLQPQVTENADLRARGAETNAHHNSLTTMPQVPSVAVDGIEPTCVELSLPDGWCTRALPKTRLATMLAIN